jgi:hypothetical protein
MERLQSPTYSNDFIVFYCYEHSCDYDEDTEYVPSYIHCQRANHCSLDSSAVRIYLGDKSIFFQFIGLYSVSSGVVSFFWPRMASISMSPSRFLNHMASVCV